MKKAPALCLLIIFNSALFVSHSFAQKQGQALIDSIMQVLPKAVEDTNKVKLLHSLSFTYNYINPDSGLKYGNTALALADKLKDKKLIATVYNDIGINCWHKSDYSKAFEYYSKALKINEEIGNKKGQAFNLGNIGNIYHDQYDDTKALEYDLKALKIFEEIGNKSGQALNLGNIGIIYRDQSNYPKTLEYFFKALKLNEETGDKYRQAINLGNLGNIYHDQSDYPKALEYCFKALNLSEEIGNKQEQAFTLGYIGAMYLNAGTGSAKVLLDSLFEGKERAALEEAKNYTGKSIILFQQQNDLNDLKDYYRQMSEVEKGLGDAGTALDYYQKFVAIKDSLFGEDNRKKLATVEKEHNEYLARQAEDEEKRKRNIKMLGIALFIVTFAVIVMLLNRWKVHHLLVRILGLLGLLMMFEFVYLILEPYINEWTHDNPIYTLPVMVVIAAIIIPTHQRLEHWVKEKLAKRRKSV